MFLVFSFDSIWLYLFKWIAYWCLSLWLAPHQNTTPLTDCCSVYSCLFSNCFLFVCSFNLTLMSLHDLQESNVNACVLVCSHKQPGDNEDSTSAQSICKCHHFIKVLAQHPWPRKFEPVQGCEELATCI